MLFNKIDLDNWSRKETYQSFMENNPCTYSITVNLDVSKFLPLTKSKNLKFFPSFLFALSHTVNRHKEFRMSFDKDKNLGYYSYSNPLFTVFHDETETFSTVWSEYDSDFDIFMQNYISDMAKYKNDAKNSKPLNENNYFNVSLIPWTSFTGFNLNLQNGYDYLSPIFTIGKYFTDNDKTLIPLAIQAHHAVCDGYHISKFINDLQDLLYSFEI